MKRQNYAALSALLLALTGCASDGHPPVITLHAGENATLVGGQVAYTPTESTIFNPTRNTTVKLIGHRNTVSTDPGTTISVAPSATGAPDNLVWVRWPKELP